MIVATHLERIRCMYCWPWLIHKVPSGDVCSVHWWSRGRRLLAEPNSKAKGLKSQLQEFIPEQQVSVDLFYINFSIKVKCPSLFSSEQQVSVVTMNLTII